ncbi:MAG TPA: FAD-binding oxidoreductase [Candidatus Limnocylindria bacterium]|jgi:FAD/FMN-containing dehydrogenase
MIEERLLDEVAGRVIMPGDADYDSARTVMMGGIDRHPAVIVRVVDAADVARVIAWARATGAELAVRSGGHSGAAHSTTEGGIVIDLRDLRTLEIDAGARTARAGTGLTAAEVSSAAAEHGLAIGFGDTGTVGIGGITLGGGVGYLSRRDGMTIDNLLGAEIVTADGRILEVDADHHPDLFWAIRGGGGNFGVATRFTYRLSALDGVVGGMLVLPATPETVAGWIAANEAAPDELSTIANVMPCPPMPMVPEEHHGSLVIFGMVAWSGQRELGEAAIAPFRALATPLADMVQPISYPEMFPPEDAEYHPTAVSTNLFMRLVDESVAGAMLEALAASDAPMRAVQLRVQGGAIARVPADATAYAHRSSPIMVNIAAFYDGADDRASKQAWVDELSAALDQGEAGAYVNFVGDEGADRVRAAYPAATFARLAAVKSTYDPTNLFRLNQNVPPAAER